MSTMQKILLIIILLVPGWVSAQTRLPVGVARFIVQGPESSQYLGGAAQDAIVGSLLQQGWNAHAIDKALDPNKLKSVKQGRKLDGLVVAGRILVVGNTYRVRLKWVNNQGKIKEDYLQVKSLDDLLPRLETYAVKNLQAPVEVLTKKEKKEFKKTVFEKEIMPPPVAEVPAPRPAQKEKVVTAPPPPPQALSKEELVSVPPPEEIRPEPKSDLPPVPKKKPDTPKKSERLTKKEREEEKLKKIRDYYFISDRLPFEVRGIAHADVTGDGRKDILMTSQQKLYLYRFQDGKLDLMAEYSGGPLDNFVKVDVWTGGPGGSPLVALTDLRGSRAQSKLLKYEGGVFIPVIEKIPFQLRVVKHGGESLLLGSPYYAKTTKGRHNIFRMAVRGNKLKAEEKIQLPGGTDIYNYSWVKGLGGQSGNVVAMTPLGRVRLYKKDNSKYKKVWSSPQYYGGSGNYVKVDVKDFFNEVKANVYSVPVGIRTIEDSLSPEVLVVKNNSLVKNVIGRVPVISSGQIFRLTFDKMGFVESWISKKVDGSIQDYLVTTTDEGPQLMAAVRLRGPGLFGDMGKQDSVLLLYHLN